MNCVMTQSMADALGDLWEAVEEWSKTTARENIPEEDRVIDAMYAVRRAQRAANAKQAA